jgi:ABC-type lipoprotein release transport system permease subunit
MTINQHELKGLQVQLKQAEALVSTSEIETKSCQKREAEARRQLKSLQERVKQLEANNAEPIVSEHAILRYLERVKGIDVEAIKQEILDENASKHIKFAKNGTLKRAAYSLIFRNNVIVTVE